MNVRLSSIVREIRGILAEVGMPVTDDLLVDTINTIVETMKTAGLLKQVKQHPALSPAANPAQPATQPAAQPGPHPLARISTITQPIQAPATVPTALQAMVPAAVQSEIMPVNPGVEEINPEDLIDLDDPSLWELEDPGTMDQALLAVPAPEQSVDQAATIPEGIVPLDPEAAMAKLQAKLQNAEKTGIKRGMPGMGGGSRPLVGGGADKTPLDEQRKILAKLTGRPQEAPPAGMMKPN